RRGQSMPGFGRAAGATGRMGETAGDAGTTEAGLAPSSAPVSKATGVSGGGSSWAGAGQEKRKRPETQRRARSVIARILLPGGRRVRLWRARSGAHFLTPEPSPRHYSPRRSMGQADASSAARVPRRKLSLEDMP